MTMGVTISDVLDTAECSACRFANRNDDQSYCCRRRHPDRETGTDIGVWPVVNPDDWCGEFQPGTTHGAHGRHGE